MKKEQEQVKDFMQRAGQEAPNKPIIPDSAIGSLRINLIREELEELDKADYNENIVEIADAIGDLLVVVLGTAVAYGLNIEPIFNEIHRSNMTKFIDGYKREDGKWIKGPSYSPANLLPIIESQK